MRGTPCGSDGECGVHYVFYAAEGALLEHLQSATLKGVIDHFMQKQAEAAAETAATAAAS
jgi:DNA-binding IscR family transcriptional regulator